MAEELTKREKQVLDYIQDFINKKAYPPSVREIGKAVGLSSTSTVHGYLERLEKKGFLRRDNLKPRAIAVNTTNSNLRPVPVLGRIAAGEPITAVEYRDNVIFLPEDFTGHGEFFVLEIHGRSMINVGIMDGDLVVVRKQATAENGDIVAALIDDEATIKRFYKENGHFRLQPENDTMQPIIVNDVTILGKAVSLIRKY